MAKGKCKICEEMYQSDKLWIVWGLGSVCSDCCKRLYGYLEPIIKAEKEVEIKGGKNGTNNFETT